MSYTSLKEKNIMGVNEYNILVKKILNDENWLEPFLKLVKEYYIDNGAGGSLHIVLDDGNLEDHFVSWATGYAEGVKDERGGRIGTLLCMMTEAQRKLVYDNYDNYA